MPTLFITGIDTDVGKTFATGLLARHLVNSGQSVITQKMVQTGCEGFSEDLQVHRQIMGMRLTNEDKQGLTCPYLFKLPASPHLAAGKEQKTIETEQIHHATHQLEKTYNYVLVEGVGGIYVPLNETVTTIDYIAQYQYPLILVSSSKLGSINHTLLTLEAASQRKLDVLGIIYNQYPTENPAITEDSKQIFKQFLKRFGYNDIVVPIPKISLEENVPNINFSPILP